ncbi:MAG: anti-sigma factor [Pirellulales bacterium]
MSRNDDLFPDDVDWDGDLASGLTDWEQAAAACELAFVAGGEAEVAEGCELAVEPLPAVVAERIRNAAAGQMERNPATAGGRSAARSTPVGATIAPQSRHGHDGSFASMLVPAAGLVPASRLMQFSGWCLALGLGLALLWQLQNPPTDDGLRQRAIGVEPPVAATPTDRRQLLLAEDPAALSVAWTGGKDAAIAAAAARTDDAGPNSVRSDNARLGDVVWSQSRQQGFMRFRGLAANDPTVEQYQLWIFDADRDEDYPVDGGVFDVAASDSDGEIVVAIDARLPVGKPTLFAITVERPGGVVVSSRERLPLLAQVP